MEQNREDIWIVGRNKEDVQQGVPSDEEDTISFQLSSVPDQYWTTIFINTWEENLDKFPEGFYNIQPRFVDNNLIVNVFKTINLRWVEEKLREINALVNEYASEE